MKANKKSLELYIHIPFCVKKCDYCDFLSFPAGQTLQDQYMEHLLKEIRAYGRHYPDYEIVTVFFGGGTPSLPEAEWILRIMECVRECFSLAEDAEITMECNPGTLSPGKLSIYKKAGINRLSIGLQSADDKELKLLGRIHTWQQFLDSYRAAREAGFDNINIDLIHSIPGQKPDAFARNLAKVVELAPEHLSVYSLIIEPGTPFYDRYEQDVCMREMGKEPLWLPTEEEEYQMGRETTAYLREHGYEQYEISNYAQKGMACRHNLGYWTMQNYLGVGLGASSCMEDVRFSNPADLKDYLQAVEEVGKGSRRLEDLPEERDSADRSSRMEEFVFLGLRLTEGFAAEAFAERFGVSIREVYGSVIGELQRQNLLQPGQERICLTEKGMDLANYCMSAFLIDKEV